MPTLVSGVAEFSGDAVYTLDSPAFAMVAGNFLQVATRGFAGVNIFDDIQDTAGNTFIPLLDPAFANIHAQGLCPNGQDRIYAFYVDPATSLGHAANVVTITWAGGIVGVFHFGINVLQYSGIPDAPFVGVKVKHPTFTGLVQSDPFDTPSAMLILPVGAVPNTSTAGMTAVVDWPMVLQHASDAWLMTMQRITTGPLTGETAEFQNNDGTGGGSIIVPGYLSEDSGGSPSGSPGGSPGGSPDDSCPDRPPHVDPVIIAKYAEADGGPLADDPDSPIPGYKEARITSVSSFKRAVSTRDGGLQYSSCTVTCDDSDRAIRSEWGITRFNNRKATIYVIDHADRINKLEPYRKFAGFIPDHGGTDDLMYEFKLEGGLGRHSARALQELKVPRNLLSIDQFPELAERWASGWSPPIGYGELSDETDAVPQGVVRGMYVGFGNFQALFGGIDKDVDFYVFFGHAIHSSISFWYNDPDTPDLRIRIPDASFAVGTGPVWAHGKANWTDTGLPVDQGYADYLGYRYYFVAVDRAHALAPAGREGRSILTGNFYGIEDVGDGTGKLIVHPVRIWQHFWTNFVENAYACGPWYDVPFFGDYSLIDTARIAAAAAYSNTWSIPPRGAILIGRDGQQVPVFDVNKEMCASWHMEVAENRHGQVFADHENPDATAAITFTDQHDLIKFRARTDRSGYANVVRCWYGYRYVKPAAPTATPAEGKPLPMRAVIDTSPWAGFVRLINQDAIDANDGLEQPLDLHFYGVRDKAVATVLAQRYLDQAVGPELEGPVIAEAQTGLQGLGVGADEIDLTTTLALSHIEGLGANGFEGRRVRIIEIVDDDVLRQSMTLRGRVQAA